MQQEKHSTQSREQETGGVVVNVVEVVVFVVVVFLVNVMIHEKYYALKENKFRL